MKNKKIIISCLIISILTGVFAPTMQVLATEEFTNDIVISSNVGKLEESRVNDNDLAHYDEIDVLKKTPKDTSYLFVTNNISDSFQINKKNIEIARQGVLDLKLSDKSLYFIEEACLAELKEIEKDKDCILNEYTVLIPKSKSTTPSFYKTYSGRDYYSSLTSRSNLTIQKNKFAKGEKLAMWFNNTVSLGLLFNNIWQVSLLQTVAGASLPAKYSVHSSDWMDSYINVNPTNRAIYAKKGAKFVNLVNNEFGKVRPYFIYHYNDAKASSPTATFYYKYFTYPDVTNSNNTSLLYTAKQVYDTGANPVNIYLKNVIKVNWK